MAGMLRTHWQRGLVQMTFFDFAPQYRQLRTMLSRAVPITSIKRP